MFLTIILVHFGVVAFLIFWGSLLPDSIVLNFLLSQGILVVPTIIFLLIFERRERPAAPQMPMRGMPTAPGAMQMPMGGMPTVPGAMQAPMAERGRKPRRFEASGFHKVKISTLLMIALCTFLISPLVTVLNVLTMFFADNAVAALEGDIISTPFPVMLFMIGIFGPFCEEFVFRGVIYGSYRRNGQYNNNICYQKSRRNGISAVLLSAFLFGLMHMNFNQALYAFAIGIFLALLVEAAGSLWASVFCHMFFNSCQVVLMYVSESVLDSIYGQAVNEAAEQLSTQDLLAALSVYLVIAAVATPIAGCVIVWIAKNEGRQEAFRELFRRSGRTAVQKMPQPNARMLNVPMPPQSQPVQWSQPAPPRQMPEMPQPPRSAQWNQPIPPQPVPPAQWNQPMPQQPVQWNMSEPPRTDYLLSVPLIIAVVLCLGYMSLELFLV